MPAGRPTIYSDELAAKICARLADGESLRSVCRDEDMPAASTAFLWMRENKEFLEQYTRAKEESADAYSEDLIEIADNPEGDVQRDKLRVDTRKWLASKLKPKRYGDKVEHSGPGGGPLQVSISSEDSSVL